MRKFGLIGFPLEHSFSPNYFKNYFIDQGIQDASYEAIELPDISQVRSLLESGIAGFNVTIPYKESIIGFLDKLDKSAEEIGAVNTVKNVNCKWLGYNTDVFGFDKSLQENYSLSDSNKALILGSGGSSKAVAYVLEQCKIAYRVVSRGGHDLSYDDIDQILVDQVDLIINTTPLGMYPRIEQCVSFPFEFLCEKHLVFDLIYNPEKTLFLAKAQEHSARIKNGLDMLVYQAQKSWEIWNN